MEKTSNNYEKCITDWQERFLSMNHEELMQRIPSLKREGDFLTIMHFGKKFAVSIKTGKITVLPAHFPASQNEQFNIYTFFWYCSPLAHFCNEWLPFASLKNASVFGPAFQKGVLDVLAKTFEGHMQALADALEALGGKKLCVGDVGYEISAFHEIPMRIIFWDKDDEFSAQANMLFDKSSTRFIHVESVVTIASVCIDRLSELSGLPIKGDAFNSSRRNF